jgi:hypothetical protein
MLNFLNHYEKTDSIVDERNGEMGFMLYTCKKGGINLQQLTHRSTV